MPPAKKPPVTSSGRKPVARTLTKSGHVLETPSPAPSRISNGANSRESNTPTSDWWRDAGDPTGLSERDRKRMSAAAHAMGEQYHSLADSLYRPEEPTGKAVAAKVPTARNNNGKHTRSR